MISEIEKLFYPNGWYVRAIRFDKLLTKIWNDMQIDWVDEYWVARISIDNHLIFWDLNKSLNQQNIETIESIYKLINKYEKNQPK